MLIEWPIKSKRILIRYALFGAVLLNTNTIAEPWPAEFTAFWGRRQETYVGLTRPMEV